MQDLQLKEQYIFWCKGAVRVQAAHVLDSAVLFTCALAWANDIAQLTRLSGRFLGLLKQYLVYYYHHGYGRIWRLQPQNLSWQNYQLHCRHFRHYHFFSPHLDVESIPVHVHWLKQVPCHSQASLTASNSIKILQVNNKLHHSHDVPAECQIAHRRFRAEQENDGRTEEKNIKSKIRHQKNQKHSRHRQPQIINQQTLRSPLRKPQPHLQVPIRIL